MFFLQMSGFPGSGKSTLAKRIAKMTGAIIVDHDIFKSALLNSLGPTNIDSQIAGQLSYTIEWALIDSYLSQGHKVILDSPCLYSEMIDRGTKLTEKHRIQYKYVECTLNDFIAINNRLKNRERMISQIDHIASEESFLHWVDSSKKPAKSTYLTIDTSQPIDSYIDQVFLYLNS